jgi:hypothetical protein
MPAATKLRKSREPRGIVVLAEVGQHEFGFQPCRRLGESRSEAIAAPAPFRRVPCQAGAHGIQRKVAAKLGEIGVLCDQQGIVAALQHVAIPIVALVEMLRIHGIQELHSVGEVRFRRFQQDVEMVRHLAEAVA